MQCSVIYQLWEGRQVYRLPIVRCCFAQLRLSSCPCQLEDASGAADMPLALSTNLYGSKVLSLVQQSAQFRQSGLRILMACQYMPVALTHDLSHASRQAPACFIYVLSAASVARSR